MRGFGLACGLALVLGCNGAGGQGGDDTGKTGSGTSGTGESGTGTGSGTGTSSTSTEGSSSDTDTSDTGKLDLPPACEVCGNKVWACADGIDNDDDGKVDMADPECLSPCNDDEGAFFHGIPAGNWDCGLDCVTDANWGHGDDSCEGSAVCHPTLPDGVGCDFNPDSTKCTDPIDQACLEVCLPTIPPGCDCFGCCEIDLGNTKITVQTGLADDDCRLDNLDGCVECVQRQDCVQPCDTPCQWCFGQEEPPGECESVSCPADSQTCFVDAMGNDDCPPCEHCLLGCCVPTPEW